MLAGKALGLTDALMVSGVGIVVVMAELALLAVLVFLLSKLVSTLVSRKNDGADSTEAFTADTPTATSAVSQPASTGSVALSGVDEPTAAVIMANVSNHTGVALEHLDFKAIRLLDTPLELIGVDEPTAATLMAIVSHQTGIPLEKLDFRRIRSLDWNGVDEPTAAIIMALVSHQTGIPLERLEFKSIKLIEE